MALEALHVMNGVRQHHHATLREHDVVIQLLAQPLPQVERMVVELGAFVIEVVGADDGGIAPRIAAAEPTLLDHCHIADAVLLGQIIGRAQAVPAGADNHDVIFGFRLGIRPLLLPALVAAHRLAKERSPGELRHGYRSEEHTSELQSLMRISYAVFCLKKKKQHTRRYYVL